MILTGLANYPLINCSWSLAASPGWLIEPQLAKVKGKLVVKVPLALKIERGHGLGWKVSSFHFPVLPLYPHVLAQS